jgi:hypothetical protein
MSVLAERLLAVHDALSAAGLAHAFGGAIALAYCTGEPRGTRDLDVNVFVGPERGGEVLAALPAGVAVSAAEIDRVQREGQVRVWWADTPIDVFLDVHAFHRSAAQDVRSVAFEGREIPVLGCTSLLVFKALFSRTQDWADIEAMVDEGTVDIDEATKWLRGFNECGDEQTIARLRALARPSR